MSSHAVHKNLIHDFKTEGLDKKKTINRPAVVMETPVNKPCVLVEVETPFLLAVGSTYLEGMSLLGFFSPPRVWPAPAKARELVRGWKWVERRSVTVNGTPSGYLRAKEKKVSLISSKMGIISLMANKVVCWMYWYCKI